MQCMPLERTKLITYNNGCWGAEQQPSPGGGRPAQVLWRPAQRSAAAARSPGTPGACDAPGRSAHLWHHRRGAQRVLSRAPPSGSLVEGQHTWTFFPRIGIYKQPHPTVSNHTNARASQMANYRTGLPDRSCLQPERDFAYTAAAARARPRCAAAAPAQRRAAGGARGRRPPLAQAAAWRTPPAAARWAAFSCTTAPVTTDNANGCHAAAHDNV